MNDLIQYVNKQKNNSTQSTDFGVFTADEALKIMKKYPDRVPVLVGKAVGSNAPEIDKHKFLVPYDLTVGQFQFVIRKRLKLSPEKALFLIVDNIVPCTGHLMSSVYEEHLDKKTRFLMVTYNIESTFGFHQNTLQDQKKNNLRINY
jgi:GABA(A) receptor-associated protein